ncbi:MAG TPA: VTT domain-containing protein [Bryobacteraceae bacterium]|nr:VTT domain-containing protein [Bryobacteraceae bacterium]
MADHLEIVRTLKFVERHGNALLFLWVLAEQSAIPVPSAPLLLAAGALIHTGRMYLVPALLSCMAGALIADTVWFELGRHRGRQVLRLVCRLSLEPDSCVRQTENAFQKYGMKSLLVSKFIPGLNSVAAPLAGHSRSSFLHFAAYDIAGALIWSGSYIAVGYVFSEQLETVIGYGSRLGSNLLLVVATLFAAWIGWKFLQRRRFLKQLAVARITPTELQQRLVAGEELFIIDLRSGLETESVLVPGAVRISPDELIARSQEIPRDREIILFCS